MVKLRQIYTVILTFSLAVLIAIVPIVTVGAARSDASTYLSPVISIASSNRVKAISKDLEGKVQETYGNVTDSLPDQVMGKTKQIESQMLNKVEDLNDQLREASPTKQS
ncbi:MAG: hypothetical protein OHK0012_01990 [Synechococcales cyanobacterium]